MRSVEFLGTCLCVWPNYCRCGWSGYGEDLAQVIRNTDQSDLFARFSYRAQCHNKYMHVDLFYYKWSENGAWLHCVVKELVKFVMVNSNTRCISSCKYVHYTWIYVFYSRILWQFEINGFGACISANTMDTLADTFCGCTFEASSYLIQIVMHICLRLFFFCIII